MDISAYLKENKRRVDSFLETYFSAPMHPAVLHQSVVYSLSAGGKRIRPVLCIASHEACGGVVEDALPFAAALELIHTYSLIHDDLPAMDNDDLRRGKPTNHKVYGEGMAILAGDALLTEAFCLLSDASMAGTGVSSEARLKVVHEIAFAAGGRGMVGGQAQDLLSEDAEPDAETLSFIHRHKTAALIAASVRAGGMLASCDEAALRGLTEYGETVGLAFQIIDDILDVEGDTEVLGKQRGSDEKKKKMTYPRLYGLDASKREARKLMDRAEHALETFDRGADRLREIARFVIERRS
ncbi:MAG: polyprenyl synthetase family protein [Chloroflexota bacterium]